MAWPDTIDATKGAVENYKPVYLLTFTAVNGAVLRVCSEPLNVTEAGYGFPVLYAGDPYLGRVARQSLAALQQLSAEGLDVMPSLQIALANADMAMYDWDRANKFLGSRLRVEQVLWEVGSNNFSTDSFMVFIGRCGKPEVDDDLVTIQASQILNLSRKLLPTFQLAPRCPKVQGQSADAWAAADDPTSIFFPCGLHAPGGAAPAYVQPCHQTPEGCAANNNSNRFAGIQWNPPNIGTTREYISGNTFDVRSDRNVAKYGEYVPIVLGTAWIDCIVTNSIPDGNSTRGEAILCEGRINAIYKVVVNDEVLPAANALDLTPYRVENPLFNYHVLNAGNRDGGPNPLKGFDGNGDPYGSMAAITWVVPRKVESGGVPRVRALVQGPNVRVYTDASSYSETYSDNHAWQILAMLTRAGLDYADIDLDSFVAAAAYYNQLVTYTDQYGNTAATHARYRVSMVIRSRRSVADILSGLLKSCNSVLRWSSKTGKVQLVAKGTLADQQPAPIEGSNYGTAIASQTAAGVATSGYAAFRLTESEIVKRNGRLQMRRLARSVADLPNRVSFGFANSERDWSGDSISVVDTSAVNDAGQEIDAQIKIDAVNTLDHAKRIAQMFLNEVRADQWEIETSFRALKVASAQLVQVHVPKYSLSNKLMRVLKIAPAPNGETIRLTLSEHSDEWYLNTAGQSPDPARPNALRNRLERPSYPWAPFEVAPGVDDPLYAETDYTFSLTPTFVDLAVGQQQRLTVAGKRPVNDVSQVQPPIIARQGTHGAGGSGGSGELPGGGWTYYMSVCAVDADGKLSAPSDICVTVVNGAGLFAVTFGVVAWGAGTVGYRVYGGHSPATMTKLEQGSGTPATITVDTWIENGEGVPDLEFWGLIARMKYVAHGGVFGALITAVGAGTLTVPGVGLLGVDWTGYDCYIAAKGDGSALPVLNFRVTSNTEDVLTVTPNPEALGIVPNDVLVMWGKPTIGGTVDAPTITDARWVNALTNDGNGLIPGGEVGRIWRWMAGPGRGEAYRIVANGTFDITVQGPWLTTPTSESRGIVESPDWLPETAELSELNNSDPAATVTLELPIANYKNLMVRVEVASFDGGGNEPPSFSNPERVIWLLGNSAGMFTRRCATFGFSGLLSAHAIPKTTAWVTPMDIGTIAGWRATRTDNAAGDTIIDILDKDNNSILLGAKVVIPAGDPDHSGTNIVPGTAITDPDVDKLRAVMTSRNGGSNAEVTLYYS